MFVDASSSNTLFKYLLTCIKISEKCNEITPKLTTDLNVCHIVPGPGIDPCVANQNGNRSEAVIGHDFIGMVRTFGT